MPTLGRRQTYLWQADNPARREGRLRTCYRRAEQTPPLYPMHAKRRKGPIPQLDCGQTL